MSERCSYCSHQPTSREDYCEDHRPPEGRTWTTELVWRQDFHNLKRNQAVFIWCRGYFPLVARRDPVIGWIGHDHNLALFEPTHFAIVKTPREIEKER